MQESLSRPTPETSDLHTIAVQLAEKAATHGVTLETERLESLASKAAQAIARRAAGENVAYSSSGLMIGHPVEQEGSEQRIAQMHFLPRTRQSPRGATFAQAEEVTRITLAGIRSLQDYLLLVEAGCLEKPDILFGHTNPELARTVERFGFVANGVDVTADFDTVHDRAFSPRTLSLEAALTTRLSNVSL